MNFIKQSLKFLKEQKLISILILLNFVVWSFVLFPRMESTGPDPTPTPEIGGAITLWYLDGSTLKPVDPSWSAEVGASVSGNFEIAGYASASQYFGSAFVDGDCSGANDTLNWDASTGTFTCGTDAAGSVSSNSIDFDEIVDSATLDANFSIASTSNNYNIDFNGTDLVDIGSASFTRGFKVGSNLFRVSNTGVVTNGTWNGTQIDISDYTNLTAGTDLTLTGDDLTLDSTLTQNFTFSGANILFSNNASVSSNFEVEGGVNFNNLVDFSDIAASASLDSNFDITSNSYDFQFDGDVRFGDADDIDAGLYYTESTDQLSLNGQILGGGFTFSGSTYYPSVVAHTNGLSHFISFLSHAHSDISFIGGSFSGSRSRGAHGASTIVQNNDGITNLTAFGHDGTDYEPVGSVRFEVDGTPGNNDMPGRIVFMTTPDNSATQTERMRIGSSGLVTIAQNALISGSASVSGNFESVGFASTSQFFGGNASHQFSGSLSGPSTGTLSVGTSNNPLKILWSNIVRAVNRIFFPVDVDVSEQGEFSPDTASKSLDWHDGTRKVIHLEEDCKDWNFGSPNTAKTYNFGQHANEPFIITSIYAIASDSNDGVTWNIDNNGTDVFTTDKQASAAFTYTTINTPNVAKGTDIKMVIASASATAEDLRLNVCRRFVESF